MTLCGRERDLIVSGALSMQRGYNWQAEALREILRLVEAAGAQP
jgi:hypothetical protein